MTATQKKPARPTNYPSGWPTDTRSRITEMDGIYFIAHPERHPHLWDAESRTWKEIRA